MWAHMLIGYRWSFTGSCLKISRREICFVMFGRNLLGRFSFSGEKILKKIKSSWKSVPRRNSVYNIRSKNVHFLRGETVLVTETRFKGGPHLMKLKEDGESKLKSRNGKKITVKHNELIGMEDNGRMFYLNGVPFKMKRPSLEEYVLYMDRGATPSYPKDIQAILMMLDARQGGCYLEAGSGSGALTLFLSKTVGQEGHIHSFDNNPKHYRKAVENFTTWCESWDLSRPDTWPRNVTFYQQSVRNCTDMITDAKLDGVLLDLQFPEEFLEHILPIIKPQTPIVIFLPSITQVVDVIKHCSNKSLPVDVISIVEVIHRFWKVLPVTLVSEDTEDERTTIIKDPGGLPCTMKYTAKPSFQQLPHTGFILKMMNSCE